MHIEKLWVRPFRRTFLTASAAGVIICLVGCGSGIVSIPAPVKWTIATGDLRFQNVGTIGSSTPYEFTFVLGGGDTTTWGDYYGTPLELGVGNCGSLVGDPTDCAWGYSISTLPTTSPNLNDSYISGLLSDLSKDSNLTDTTKVVRSLDIEPLNNAYGMASWSDPDSTGFTSQIQIVPLASLQAVISERAAKGSVTTALGIESAGQAYVVSYNWSRDSSSSYDSTTVSVTSDTLETQAEVLANSGYVITAFGGDHNTGMFLVGTRLAGSSAPRKTQMIVGELSASDFPSGYAVVAVLAGASGTSTIWVLEQ